MWDRIKGHIMNVCAEEKRIKTELIKLYEINRCLWDTNSEDYRNNALKDATWLLLLSKYKELDPEIDSIGDVKSKFANWRTAYKREVKKVRDSIQRKGFEHRYHPQLWYFNLFSFLEGNGSEGFEEGEQNDDNSTSKTDPLGDEGSDEYFIVNPDVKEELTEIKPSSSKKPKDKRKPIVIEAPASFREHNKKKRLECSDSDEEVPKKHRFKEEQEPISKISPFVLYIDDQLKSLSKYQRLIAEKLFSEVIFLAKTENLTLDSKVEVGRPLVQEVQRKREEVKHSEVNNGDKTKETASTEDSGNILKEYLLMSD